MSSSPVNHSENGPSRTIRRGFLAAAWAAVAALVLKQTTQPVEAGVDGDVVLGASNTTASLTEIINTGSNSTAFQAFAQTGGSSRGILGAGGLFGVIGSNVGGGPGNPGAAVFGSTTDVNSSAIWGVQTGSPSGVAVRGEATFGASGTGVLGTSTSGIGVSGQIPSTSHENGIAVYGLNVSTYAGPNSGAGGFGIYGLSAKGHGLVGAVATAGAAAVVGAINGVAGAYAAAFFGPVVVGGDFTVVGGAKSAAVPHPDGTHRRLYCVESPESWFEDFGEAQLECGRTDVTIDPDFAAIANLESYHVFVTQYGGMDVLSVTERTPATFRVEAKDPGSTTRFSWRIVAKRKDIEGRRLAPVSIPAEPALPSTPSFADAPRASTARR